MRLTAPALDATQALLWCAARPVERDVAFSRSGGNVSVLLLVKRLTATEQWNRLHFRYSANLCSFLSVMSWGWIFLVLSCQCVGFVSAGIISTFLHVHPFGASIEYICSYLQRLDTKVPQSAPTGGSFILLTTRNKGWEKTEMSTNL